MVRSFGVTVLVGDDTSGLCPALLVKLPLSLWGSVAFADFPLIPLHVLFCVQIDFVENLLDDLSEGWVELIQVSVGLHK